jgi:hypothetical protein
MTQAATKAQVAAFGAVISIGGVTGATGTETFTPIGEIVGTAKVSGMKFASADVSTFASNVKRKVGTMVDYGTVTFTTLRVSTDAGQAAVVAACATGQLYDFKIQLVPNGAAGQVTTGDLIAFSALVTEAGGFDLDMNKASEYSFTLDIDGVWTVTEGA